MKISLKWLSDYISVSEFFERPQDLAAMLTAAGLEVESIDNRARAFDHVVVGCILKKETHPNADRLTLCQVGIGDGKVVQIVCGARNHSEGDRVVVALPGAVLPGDFRIQHSQIRGVDSSGMLCSEKELGFKAESEGILILAADAPVGTSFAKYRGIDDVIFELKVTPNRADCLSHFGLAREVACLTGREAKLPQAALIENGGSTRDQVRVEIAKDCEDLCPRYAGRGVRNVKVGPSPMWLKTHLEAVGINSINNVVDITNFVMLELGHPMHAFDVRELQGRIVKIDRAVKGEKFTTLDGIELEFDGSELTIRDEARAVAVAGVVGGQNSGIKDDTTEIFLEAAYFTPSTVRRTARKFGIETDSSYRFARGTNPEAVVAALNRASQLIQTIAGGDVMGSAYDLYPKAIAREPIVISLSRLNESLGFKADADEFVDWMKRLGCEVLRTTELVAADPEWRVQPPLSRWDLSVDMDLVEEFARLHGYQHIPEALPALAVAPARHDPSFIFDMKVRRVLQGEGLDQAINYAFLSASYQDRVLGDTQRLNETGLHTSSKAVSLMNPLNEELAVMRLAVLPGLIRNVQHNSRQGNASGRLFELGFAHLAPPEVSAGVSGHAEGARPAFYAQQARLALAFWGSAETLWSKASASPLVFELKSVVENLLTQLGVASASRKSWSWRQLNQDTAPQFLHPGRSATLWFHDGSTHKPIGFIGELHPVLAGELKIRETCAVCELTSDALIQASHPPHFEPISKLPAVERDLAFTMPKSLPVASIEELIFATGGELLRSVAVFDVFEGASLPAGQRSVAFRLKFQSKAATLEDAIVNQHCDQVVDAVQTKFSIRLRA